MCSSDLDRLAADDEARGALAEAGAAYVDANFRWPVIIGRYRRFLEALVS